MAHNGNIVNAENLQESLKNQGYVFNTSTDTEIIANLILSSPGDTWVDKIRYAMHRLQGAYSLTILTADTLFAVRDPLGVRPLGIGRINGEGYILAGEDCVTSVPGIFAAGDVRGKPARQIVTAVADGANAVLSAEKYFIEQGQSCRYV